MSLISWLRPKRNDYWRNREWNMAVERVRNLLLGAILIAIAYGYLFLLYFFQL